MIIGTLGRPVLTANLTIPQTSRQDEAAASSCSETGEHASTSLDWDALNLLTRDEQDKILHDVFSPEGDLRITRGRISMGANDYSRSWYACDEVKGDFELRYFNIDRDKQTVIPFIRAAQKFNPDMTFWISPWCPPSLDENKRRLSRTKQQVQQSFSRNRLPALRQHRRKDRSGRDETDRRTQGQVSAAGSRRPTT